MTRDEAIYKAMGVAPGSVISITPGTNPFEIERIARRRAEGHVDTLVALGLLKLDEPKPVHELAFGELKRQLDGLVGGRDVAQVIDAINANGFKIVKA